VAHRTFVEVAYAAGVRRLLSDWLAIWRTRRILIRTARPPVDAARELVEAKRRSSWADPVPHGPLRVVVGRVSAERVWLTARRLSFRNSWRPVLRGRLVEVPGGTELVGGFACLPFVQVFTALWLGLIGLFGLIGLAGAVAQVVRGDWTDLGPPLGLAGGTLAVLTLATTLMALASRSGLRDEEFLRRWLAARLADRATPPPRAAGPRSPG
jgi:hypothetical protein